MEQRRGEMEKWLLAVETNCKDSSKEEEFNEWYNNIHVPDILEIPGIIRATRYENSNPAEGRGKYMALYEIEADDFGQVMVALQEKFGELTQQGRISEQVAIVTGTPFRHILGPVDSK